MAENFGGPSQDQIDSGTDPQLSGLYRPRRKDGVNPPPGQPAPPTPQAPGSFENRIYQPRYVDPGNPIWAGISDRARPGSVLGIISAFARAPYDQAMQQNRMELMKHEESVNEAKVMAEAERWNAVADAQRALANERNDGGRKTWQDRFREEDPEGFAKWATGRRGQDRPTEDLPKEVKTIAWGNPQQPGEDDAAYHQRIYGLYQKQVDAANAARSSGHAGRQGNPRILVDKTTGDTYAIGPDGKPVPVTLPNGEPAHFSTPGAAPRPKSTQSPAEYKAKLMADLLKQNSGAPLNERQMNAVNEQTVAYMRSLGVAPDQRAAQGPPGAAPDQSHVTAQAPPPAPKQPKIVRTGTAADGSRVAMLDDGRVVPLR